MSLTLKPGMHPAQASTPMMYGQQHMYPSMDVTMGAGPGFMQNVTFSGKHNGICLYLARILRYTWLHNLEVSYIEQYFDVFSSEDLKFVGLV